MIETNKIMLPARRIIEMPDNRGPTVYTIERMNARTHAFVCMCTAHLLALCPSVHSFISRSSKKKTFGFVYTLTTQSHTFACSRARSLSFTKNLVCKKEFFRIYIGRSFFLSFTVCVCAVHSHTHTQTHLYTTYRTLSLYSKFL